MAGEKPFQSVTRLFSSSRNLSVREFLSRRVARPISARAACRSTVLKEGPARSQRHFGRRRPARWRRTRRLNVAKGPPSATQVPFRPAGADALAAVAASRLSR
jgi:hypothetical protein